MSTSTSSTAENGLHFTSQRWTNFDPAPWLKKWSPNVDWVGLRMISEISQSRTVRNEKPEAIKWNLEEGVLIEVMKNGHIGYAGTSSLTPEGLNQAFESALAVTKLSSNWKVTDLPSSVRPKSEGSYHTPIEWKLDRWSLAEMTDFLMAACKAMKVGPEISQTLAEVTLTSTGSRYASSLGNSIDQSFLFTTMNFQATAQDGTETQRRSANGPVSRCFQGGLEWLKPEALIEKCSTIGREALELLKAENCPSGARDSIIAPDQMYLQIHESIGHPLELDRILGDERNYAGWSFVKPTDFGNLQYGSPLMNVTFDPGVPGEFASYSFDDCGNPSKREHLIKDGKLLRGLGSLESQHRSQLPGVANFRTASWNRAPIDRMANINVEAGNTKLADMISSIEKGIYMEANVSWSIDDYRDKFQFGCEFGRLIENGKLTKVVKNPNYRGRTLDFWRSLAAVGTQEEWEIYGSPFCGKGEPSQVIRVGHGSPPCLFKNLEVFGG